MKTKPCPCQSKLPFELCCKATLDGKKQAETAEQLMRSRYTAYTLCDVNYLMKSHHALTRPEKDRKQIEQWAKSVQWMGLQIISKRDGLASDQKGIVEFKAFYLENGELNTIHERSVFVREEGNWLYHSGEFVTN